MTALRVINGGSCPLPGWQCEEARVDLIVSQGERAIFVRAVAGHIRTALLRLAQPQPDADGCERVLIALDRLAAQEEIRCRAEFEPEPSAMRIAA